MPGPKTTILQLSAACLLAMTLFFTGSNVRAADYSIELIVYANLQTDSGVEQWPEPRTWPAVERSLLLGEASTRPLDGTRELQAIADTLRRSSTYRMLLHWYWQQPGWSATQTRPVLVQIPPGTPLPVTTLPEQLSRAAPPPPAAMQMSITPADATGKPLLDGTVSLISGEILQVDVDLIYRDSSLAVPVQLKESRRLRSGELQYLDHPRFGVLVRVTPITPAAQ